MVTNARRSLIVVGVSGLCGVLLAGLALPVVAGLGLTARATADTFQEMPSALAQPPLPERSVVLDTDGNTLATFYSENRIYVGLDAIAPVMTDAMLAIEDARFYDRGPIDFQGTLRALIRNVEAGETTGGGSTLTQQYVKLVRLSQAGDDPAARAAVLEADGLEGYKRKLEELRMAIGVEEELTKDEIFERYLNIAYYGAGTYGVEAAARAFFSTTAAELTLPQAATIAGLVQSPGRTDPTTYPEATLNRRNIVLNRMAETGVITEAAAAEARDTDLGLNLSDSPNGCVSAYAGFFCDYVVAEVRTMPELGDTPDEREDRLNTGGLVIRSTIDPTIQEAADEAIAAEVDPGDEPIGSAVTVEPSTGFIRAMANSRNYGNAEDGSATFINYAVDASMGGGAGIQSGSTFKTWALAAAIRQGRGVGTMINSPQTVDLSNEPFRICQNGQTVARDPNYRPSNSTGSGTFDMRRATERSVNTYFLELTRRTGLCEPATIAQSAGVYRADGSELRQVPSFALGSNEVSPLAMAGGYGMFANRGLYCPSTSIATIEDSSGEVIVDHTEPECARVLEEDVADAVAGVLQGVISTPGATGNRMRLDGGRPAAGKTGTTNDSIAVWFAGFTPQLSTAVAVADVDGRITSLVDHEFRGRRLGSSGVCGGCIPGPIWKSIMDSAHENLEEVDFPQPDRETLQGDQPTELTP